MPLQSASLIQQITSLYLRVAAISKNMVLDRLPAFVDVRFVDFSENRPCWINHHGLTRYMPVRTNASAKDDFRILTKPNAHGHCMWPNPMHENAGPYLPGPSSLSLSVESHPTRVGKGDMHPRLSVNSHHPPHTAGCESISSTYQSDLQNCLIGPHQGLGYLPTGDNYTATGDLRMTRSKQEYFNLIFGANCSSNELFMGGPFDTGFFRN